MSLVVDFVSLEGTKSVLVVRGLILYSVFCQILPRKTVNAFCTASFTSPHKFAHLQSTRATISLISKSILGNKFWLVPLKTRALRQSCTLRGYMLLAWYKNGHRTLSCFWHTRLTHVKVDQNFQNALTKAPRYILIKSFFLAIGWRYLHGLSHTFLKRLKLLWGEIACKKRFIFYR